MSLYFRVQKKFRLERAGKKLSISVKNSLSHSDKRFRRQPFCAELQSFLQAKTFMYERGGEHQVFSSNFFISHCPKFP